MAKALDVITIGRAGVDLYGSQVGGRLEDMGSFDKYIGGSPTNIACGTARLGLKSGLITRVGDEHMGRFIREELVRHGVDVARREDRPRAADGAGHPRHTRREAVSADLLPRELRRHGALRGRHRSRLRHLGAGDCRHRHASQQPAHRDRRPEGAEDRARERGTDGARHRLPAEPLGCRGPWGGREPVRRERPGDGKAAVDAAPLRSDRGHRGGVPHRRRIDRHARRASGGSRGLGCHARVQARADGCRRLLRGHSRQPRRRRGRAGLSDRGLQRARGRRRVHVRSPEGLARRRALAEGSEIRQCLRGACGQPARLHAGLSVLAEMRILPEARCRASRPAQRSGTGAGPLGDQPHGDWSDDAGLCLRPPDADRGDGRLHLEKWRIQGALPGCGVAVRTAAPATASSATGGSGGRALQGGGDGPVDRAAGGVSRLAAATQPEIGPDFGTLVEWPREHVAKVLCFCHPGDDDEMRARQEATVLRLFTAARRNRLELLLEIIPSKVGPVDRRHDGDARPPVLCGGICPDWWKLEPMQSEAAWRNAIAAIEAHDAHTRGIVVLGLDAPEAELAAPSPSRRSSTS